MTKRTTKSKMCPSAPCSTDAYLIGRVGPDHKIRYLSQSLKVREEFVEIATEGKKPETRFRFAAVCEEASCKQWHHGRCGVADQIIDLIGPIASNVARPPKCSIRSNCRWFSQRGLNACSVCLFVTTEHSSASMAKTE